MTEAWKKCGALYGSEGPAGKEREVPWEPLPRLLSFLGLHPYLESSLEEKATEVGGRAGLHFSRTSP